MSKAKTVTERQRELRAKRQDAGFRQLNEWVHDEDRHLLVKVASELRRARWTKIIKERGE